MTTWILCVLFLEEVKPLLLPCLLLKWNRINIPQLANKTNMWVTRYFKRCFEKCLTTTLVINFLHAKLHHASLFWHIRASTLFDYKYITYINIYIDLYMITIIILGQLSISKDTLDWKLTVQPKIQLNICGEVIRTHL